MNPWQHLKRLTAACWPNTLFTRLILLMLITLVLVQSLSVMIYLQDRDELIGGANDRHIRQRISALIRLMDQSQPRQYRTILKATDNDEMTVSLSGTPRVPDAALDPAGSKLQDHLYRRTRRSTDLPIHVAVHTGKKIPAHTWPEPIPPTFEFRRWNNQHQHNGRTWHDGAPPDSYRPSGTGPGAKAGNKERHHRPTRICTLTVSVQLATGQWLNLHIGHHDEFEVWNWQAAQGLLLVAALVIGIMIWLVKSNTRPLQKLAHTAEQIGRGQYAEPLEEEGAEEVRHTIQAFNTMQEKQQRFIKDRVLMLAAISHDLKTPLTKLRLQSEFVTDNDIQAQQLKTLSDMEAMLNATMNFAKDDGQSEGSRTIDLVSLVQSLCDDRIANGANLTLTLPDQLVYTCRPVSMRRMLANLIDNAVKYAPSASITLTQPNDSDEVVFVIADHGPGIPASLREHVFRPFYRVEASRNRETGGMGLGLSIVRSIALLHGGHVSLSQSMPHGLTVTVTLPNAEQ